MMNVTDGFCRYSLGSNWFPVPVTSQTYSFSDDLTSKVRTTKHVFARRFSL
jgi:hypothetical protein